MAGPSFQVNVAPALQELSRLTQKIKEAWGSLDALKGGSDEALARMSEQFKIARGQIIALNTELNGSRKGFGSMAAGVRVANETLKTYTSVATANLRAEQALQRQQADLAASLGLVNTEEFKRVAADKEALKGAERMASADQRRANNTAELTEKTKAFNREEGINEARAKADLKLKEQLYLLTRKYADSLKLEKAEAHELNVGNAERALRQQIINKATRKIITLEQEEKSAVRVLAEELRIANSERAQSNERMRVQIKNAREVATEDLKRSQASEKLRRELDYINSAEGKADEQTRLRIKLSKEAAVEDMQRTAALEKLRRESEVLGTKEGQEAVRLKETNKATRDAIAEETRRSETLKKLERDLAYVQSAEGKQEAVLRAEIREQQRLATATAESNAQRRRGARISNQVTAGMRAGLMGLRTSIGMYTSSTVIAASAVFAFTRALRTGLEAGSQYTEAIQRTAAITGATAGSMSALEARVRSLGATTQFTTSEVAKATNELALVGLTAGQTMQALEPVLNLAIIGGDSIADAAVRATDAMLVFGKSVQDLPDIVNDLAVAATNSSTSVDQLTNALTYAGPAAEALGFSLKDTLAAIETLANAGIRGSRAGTSLRRAFTKLANPTKEGAEALQQMGVAVFDFNGKALPMLDILEQMRNAMQNMPKSQQVSMIEKLFGVRASSSILALLRNTDKFNQLRQQLELTNGAAAKMVGTLRDSLHFDYKDLTSSFEAMQINVFKNNEYEIRKWTEELRQFTQYLGKTADNGKTHLENYAIAIKDIGEALLAVYGIFKAKKLFFALAEGATSMWRATRKAVAVTVEWAAVGLKTAAQQAEGATETWLNTEAIKNQTKALTGNTAAKEANAAASAEKGVVGGAAAAVGGITGGIASVLTGAAAVAGIGFAIWSLYKMFKSEAPKTQGEIDSAHDAAEKAYRELKKKAEDFAQKAKLENLTKAKNTQAANIKKAQAELASLQAQADAMAKDSSMTTKERIDNMHAMNVVIGIHESRLEDMKTTYSSVKKEIDEATKSQSNYEQVLGDLRETNKKIHLSIMSGDIEGLTKLQLRMKKLREERDKLAAQGKNQIDVQALLAGSQKALVKGLQAAIPARKSEAETLSDILGEQEKYADRVNSLRTYLGGLAKKRKAGNLTAEEEKKVDEEIKQGKMDLIHVIESLIRKAQEYYDNQEAFHKSMDSWNKAEHAYEFSHMTRLQKIADLRKRINDKDLNAKIDLVRSAKGGTTVNKEQVDEGKAALREKMDLESQLKTLTESSTTTHKATASYQSLMDTLYPLQAATRKYTDTVEALTKARKKGKITPEELTQLSKLAGLQALIANQKYDGKPVKEHVRDLKALEDQMLAGAKTAENRRVIEEMFTKAINEQTSGIRQEAQELEHFNDRLQDRKRLLREQTDLKVMSVGMGHEQYQRASKLLKIRQEKNSKLEQLARDHKHTLDRLDERTDADKIARENELYKKKKKSLSDYYNDEITLTQNRYERMDEAEQSYKAGIHGGLEDVMDRGMKQADMMRDIVVGAFDDMATAVANFTTTGKLNFKSFVTNFIHGIAKMEMRVLESKIAGMLINMAASWFSEGSAAGGGYGSYGAGGDFDFTQGFSGGGWGRYAHGGTFHTGTFGSLLNTVGDKPTIVPMARGAALIREAGPEAVMPLQRGPDGKLGVMSRGGGGNVTINQSFNVTNEGSDNTMSQQQGEGQHADAIRAFRDKMRETALEVIHKEQRPGGSLWSMNHA